jgi:hypothetical protein
LVNSTASIRVDANLEFHTRNKLRENEEGNFDVFDFLRLALPVTERLLTWAFLSMLPKLTLSLPYSIWDFISCKREYQLCPF